jgi:hypothetical protein
VLLLLLLQRLRGITQASLACRRLLMLLLLLYMAVPLL